MNNNTTLRRSEIKIFVGRKRIFPPLASWCAAAILVSCLCTTPLFPTDFQEIAGKKHNDSDGSKDSYFLKLNKKSYAQGEPVFARCEYFNLHGEEVAIVVGATPKSLLNDWLLTMPQGDVRRQETLGGRNFFYSKESEIIEAVTEERIRAWYFHLEAAAGEVMEIPPAPYRLDRIFDTFCPGKHGVAAERHCSVRQQDEEYSTLLRSGNEEFLIRNDLFASSGLKKPGKWGNPAENPLELAPVTNSPKRFFDLPPEGDYSKLKLILRSNKAKHGADEPVFVRIFLKNESETEVPLCLEPSGFWGDARFSVTDSHGNSVPKTRLGKKRFPLENRPEAGIDWIFTGPAFVQVPPGREIEIGPGEILLNLFYDISRPGKYRLQITRSSLLPGQVYENPLESNELLLDTRGPALRPEDLLDPGNFETQSLP